MEVNANFVLKHKWSLIVGNTSAVNRSNALNL